MTSSEELAALFDRDLTRLGQQLSDFPEEDALWRHAPGITNSAGNLMLHLEGNLRDFVGRQLGGVAYQREREREFGASGIAASELAARMDGVRELIPSVIRGLSDAQMLAVLEGTPLKKPVSTQLFLIHLLGHLSYHLGQIDYLRRFLTGRGAVEYAQM